jgi:chemotaxis signal transduction protein
VSARLHWRIHRKREVTAYLVSLREAGTEIRRFIESLKVTGIPPTATLVDSNVYILFEADHWIALVVDEKERVIYIPRVEPAELGPRTEQPNG